MKKKTELFSRLLASVGRRWLRMTAKRPVRDLSDYQQALDARTALVLEEWVRQRGYCRPDMAMEAVADELDISKEQLSYYCRVVLGESFLTWRKHLRSAEAQRLLRRDPDLSLQMVADRVGIMDKTNFRRQFYEVCGCFPAEWLEREGLQ